MKTLKFILAAAIVLAASLASRAEVSARGWLESYYLNPEPAQLSRAIHALSREGFFEKNGRTAVAIGFLGTVFAQNPERVDRWVAECADLPPAHQRLIAAALWEAGNPKGAQQLRTLGQDSDFAVAIERLASKPSVPITDTPVLSLSSMNLQWGAFLASGDERHVVNILDGIGADHPALSTAARYSLAQNAAAHPRVMEICRAQLSKQPNEVQSVLRAALNDAASNSDQPHS